MKSEHLVGKISIFKTQLRAQYKKYQLLHNVKISKCVNTHVYIYTYACVCININKCKYKEKHRLIETKS